MSNEKLTVKTSVKNRALTVVKIQIDLEKTRKRSAGSLGAAISVIAEDKIFLLMLDENLIGSCVWVRYPRIPGSRISSLGWLVLIMPYYSPCLNRNPSRALNICLKILMIENGPVKTCEV